MTRFGRAGGTAALGVLALVAGCSSLALPPAQRLHALDYRNDDVAAMTLAFDVPLTLEPAPQASVLDFRVSAGDGQRHVTATLVRADASAVIGSLPPPAADRTYFVFGFSDADRAKVREAQAWARSQPADQTVLVVDLAPRFCRTADIDTATTRVSVLVAIPGAGGIAPLISDKSVDALLAASGESSLPLCPGHSG